MKNTPPGRPVTILFLFAALHLPLFAENITSLIHTGDTVISSGDDGFIVIWNILEKSARERFQLTQNEIKAMVKHPFKDEICIIESETTGGCVISAWDYKDKEKLFSHKSAEPVNFVNYSAGGSFIITGGFNGFDLALLDSTDGEIISAPNITAGTAAFGITGRSERNMLVYQSEYEEYTPGEYAGQLLYLELESETVTGSFLAPGNLTNPIIFGNNRFLAGINSGGLVIVDASTGAVFDLIAHIEKSSLLCPSDDGFVTLRRKEGVSILNRFTLDSRGNFAGGVEFPLPFETPRAISAVAYNKSVVLASEDGALFLLDEKNKIISMARNFQTRITEIAAAEKTIAFLTENGELRFLPIDYRLLEETQILTPEDKTGFTRITAVRSGVEDQFILWQTAGRGAPQLISAYQQTEARVLEKLTTRFPLRSISAGNGRLLVLDASGNLTARDLDDLSGNAAFSFSSIGAIDAVFADSEHIILCRGVISNTSGGSPFLIINTVTGETVPVTYPAEAGVMVYSGNSGNIYGAVVEQDVSGLKTTVLSLSLSPAAEKKKIFDFAGEDPYLYAAESAGKFAATGGQSAKIYARDVIGFERTEGLPVKLLGHDKFFIVLDSEGNICWHDNKTGTVQAVFRLYADKWILLSSGREISGKILQP